MPAFHQSLLAALLATGLASTPALAQRAAQSPSAATASWDAADNQGKAPLAPGVKGPQVLRAQILLDRARFSVGEIDASYGPATVKAVKGFQAANGLPATGRLDAATWEKLDTGGPVLTRHTLAEDDVKGPFRKVPQKMEDKAKLDRLGYESAAEGVAERFHASPALLARMNPGVAMDKAGGELRVPDVAGKDDTAAKAAKVEVTAAERLLRVTDKDGKVLAQFPVSIGSDRHDPLPLGDWKVTAVARDPKYHYNPARFWDANPKDAKAVVPAGPNNPVGVVWIDLSKENYGLHGTPEPAQIGRTASHGCVRLTNWDASRLAAMVDKGTQVVFKR